MDTFEVFIQDNKPKTSFLKLGKERCYKLEKALSKKFANLEEKYELRIGWSFQSFRLYIQDDCTYCYTHFYESSLKVNWDRFEVQSGSKIIYLPTLEIGKLYSNLDIPNKALELYYRKIANEVILKALSVSRVVVNSPDEIVTIPSNYHSLFGEYEFKSVLSIKIKSIVHDLQDWMNSIDD
jgi:hypothetical protein